MNPDHGTFKQILLENSGTSLLLIFESRKVIKVFEHLFV